MLYLTVTLNVLSTFQNTMYVALSATYIQVFWKLILEINFQTIAVFFLRNALQNTLRMNHFLAKRMLNNNKKLLGKHCIIFANVTLILYHLNVN